MKTRVLRLIATGAIAFVCIGAALMVFVAADVPSAAELPGLTAADKLPKGCVDCHSNQGEGKDYRLNVSLKQVKGHPDIASIVKTVPTDCAMCHKEGTPKALSTALHKSHYEKLAESSFVKFYSGECLNCHTLNTTTFQMKVKSGPKNW
jgi:hypothetical protein